MKKARATTRRRGLTFLRRQLGRVPIGHVAVSKYYPSKESWTGSPAWWFDLPLVKLQKNKCEAVYLLCEEETGVTYLALKVPTSHLLRNLDGFCLAENGKIIRLHLSTRAEDRFVDLRGDGNVRLARFLV
jgi:hypothetical protein